MRDFLQLFVDLFWFATGIIGGGVVSLIALCPILFIAPLIRRVVIDSGLSRKVARGVNMVLLAGAFVALACAEIGLSWMITRWFVAQFELQCLDPLRFGSATSVVIFAVAKFTMVAELNGHSIDIALQERLGGQENAAPVDSCSSGTVEGEIPGPVCATVGLNKRVGTGI